MNHPAFRILARTLAFVALLGLLGWVFFRPRPSLDGIDRLLAGGRFRAAETQLADYLQAVPGDQSARILLARTSISGPDPRPEFALSQVEGLRPTGGSEAAQVWAIRGQANFLLLRYDRAEAAWLEALRLQPSIAEVGWGLLNIYAVQGRREDTRRLALKLYRSEPDPHDRFQLLLQMIRFDAHKMEIGSLINQLAPVVAANPEDLPSSLALGSAMVLAGRISDGIDLLRKMVDAHPDRPEPWIYLAEATIEAGQPEDLPRVFAQAPEEARDSPRILAVRAWVAMQRQDWSEATALCLQALAKGVADRTVAYRLKTALHHAGQDAELARVGQKLQAIIDANDKITVIYDQLDAGDEHNPGAPPDALKAFAMGNLPEIYRRLASILRELGRAEEADLWEQQASAKDPSAP